MRKQIDTTNNKKNKLPQLHNRKRSNTMGKNKYQHESRPKRETI